MAKAEKKIMWEIVIWRTIGAPEGTSPILLFEGTTEEITETLSFMAKYMRISGTAYPAGYVKRMNDAMKL